MGQLFLSQSLFVMSHLMCLGTPFANLKLAQAILFLCLAHTNSQLYLCLFIYLFIAAPAKLLFNMH